MLNLRKHLVGFLAQLAEIDLTVADTPGQGVFNGVRLLVDLFLHVVAVDTLIARVILQIRFDVRALHFLTFTVIHHDATAGHFRNVTLFEEDKAAGHRQQSQLVRGDEVFAHAKTDNQRATGAGGQQGARIAGIHDNRTVRAAQLRDSAQNGIAQRAAFCQLPVHQVSDHFGIGFGDKFIAARS